MYRRLKWAAAVLAGLLVFTPLTPVGASPSDSDRARRELADLSSDQLMARGLTAFNARDYAAARDHFRLLAQRDNATAETLLGTMSARGQGVERNEAIAAAWFLRAARRGYAPAQLALADALARGSGVPQDQVRARALAKAAASQGLPGAAQLASRLGPERYAMVTGRRP